MQNQAQAASDTREEIQAFLDHIIPRHPYPHYVDDTVFLEVKQLLTQHSDRLVRQWAENPRLYTLLRMLGHEEDGPVFQKLDSEQIGDFWLPLSSTTLNQLAATTNLVPSDFRRVQMHILSPSEHMSEQRLLSSVPVHRHIRDGSAHFEELEKIGKGGSAEVSRVRHKLSGKQFACKHILRAESINLQRSQLIEFEQEVGVLQRVRHPHLVSFVASFTDLTSFSLILNPVAKNTLKSILERQSRQQPLPAADLTVLRQSFGCIVTALSYLHEQRVRHKDIKPGNILLSEGRVYLCDFGISRDWSKSEHSTTEGDVLKFTLRYCAPEVFGRDPRNTKSDIWSLGCVFLEIISVIKGYSLEEFNKFLLDYSGSASAQGLWCAPEAMHAWLVQIRSENNDSADDIPLDWIPPMVRTEAEERLKASDILEMIHKQSADMPQAGLFIAPCCQRTDSMAPIGSVDSPTLTNPQFDRGLGISISPPRPLLDLPNRHRSPASIDQRSNPVVSKSGENRDESVSPRSRNFSDRPRQSSETMPFSMDPLSPQPNRALRHISTRSESHRSSSQSVPLPAESIPSSSSIRRSPVPPPLPPPPANFDLRCHCAGHPEEKHIYHGSLVSSTIELTPPTMESYAKCEIGENKVQVYERLPEDPNISNDTKPLMWWVTRRLVISYLTGSPETRRCSSFWVPLADLRFSSSGSSVTLWWSDCNQMTQKPSRNYGHHYDWIYNPNEPNNSVTLQFNDADAALQFLDTIRLPYEDGITVSRGRKVDISPSQELYSFDIGGSGRRYYRTAILTLVEESYASSKLFILWPELDLDIRIQANQANRFATAPELQMVMSMKNVTTPTYHSDTRGEPAVDASRVARFARAHQVKSSFSLIFPVGPRHALPLPPIAVTELLFNLTGWTLRYFATIDKFKSKKKRFGTKGYGRADVMLWEKVVYENSRMRRGAQVTFRLHEQDAELPWTCGAITSTTSTSYYSTSFEATVTISNKSQGRWLNISKMTAVTTESSSGSASDTHHDLSELIVTFVDSRNRLEFVKLVEELKEAAAQAPPLSRSIPDADSLRRLYSFASNDIQMSLPLR